MDPLAGRPTVLKIKLSLAADPVGLVTKWVSVKLGDELSLTPDTDKVTLLLSTVTTQAAFQVPKDGSWSVRADEVAGPGLAVHYRGSEQQLAIDLSRVLVKTITITRSDGETGWDARPEVTTVSTHTVTVDTSLLTTGDFEGSSQSRV